MNYTAVHYCTACHIHTIPGNSHDMVSYNMILRIISHLVISYHTEPNIVQHRTSFVSASAMILLGRLWTTWWRAALATTLTMGFRRLSALYLPLARTTLSTPPLPSTVRRKVVSWLTRPHHWYAYTISTLPLSYSIPVPLNLHHHCGQRWEMCLLKPVFDGNTPRFWNAKPTLTCHLTMLERQSFDEYVIGVAMSYPYRRRADICLPSVLAIRELASQQPTSTAVPRAIVGVQSMLKCQRHRSRYERSRSKRLFGCSRSVIICSLSKRVLAMFD